MTSRNRGMTLISVLVSASLMAFVTLGFMTFMRGANRAQSNLAKVGEAAGIDMTIRTLLMNSRACFLTAQGVTLSNTAPQDVSFKDAQGNTVYAPNQQLNGLTFTQVQVTAAPAQNGVQLLKYSVGLRKEGDQQGKQTYAHDYYTNISVDGSGVLQQCLVGGEDRDGSFTVLGSNEYYLNFNGKCGAIIGACGVMGGINPAQYEIVGPAPQAFCPTDYSGASCTHLDGAGETFQARGNLISVEARADVTVGVGPVANCPPMAGIGTGTMELMLYEGGTLVKQVNVAHLQINGDNANIIQRVIGSSSNKYFQSVVKGHSYRIAPRFFSMGGPGAHFTSGGCGTNVSVTHYQQNNIP